LEDKKTRVIGSLLSALPASFTRRLLFPVFESYVWRFLLT
jgi:hypothetical protein